MPYKFNIFTGTLDIVTSPDGVGVTRVGPTEDKHITRWVGNDSDTIQNSKALVQDGGAIEAQGFLTRRSVTDIVSVPSGESWIAPELELEVSGSIEIEADGELIII